jgi:hypothetical protein
MHKPKMLNNPFNSNQPLPALLSEGLQYKDLDGLMKSTIHVDEFAAKMGDDDDIIVLSFFVRDLQAAKDLVAWFEKGYDFVLDADRSPGEIKPNRYLVYLEIRRRRSAPQHVQTLLDDLSTLTEFEPDQWRMHYNGKSHDWSEEAFAKLVPLTPDAYRAENETELNDIRSAAGIEPKKIHEKLPDDVKALQSMAGIR